MEAHQANAATAAQCNSILCRAAAAGDCHILRQLFGLKNVESTTDADNEEAAPYSPLDACPWHAGAMPIHLAAEAGHADAVAMLIDEYSVPANIPDALEVTPMMYAIGNNKFHILEVLASRGGAPDEEFKGEVDYCREAMGEEKKNNNQNEGAEEEAAAGISVGDELAAIGGLAERLARIDMVELREMVEANGEVWAF